MSKKIAKGDFVYKFNPLLYITKSRGVLLYGKDGKCFLDMESGNGAVALGYDPSIIENAMLKITELPNLPSFCESSIRIEYLDKLARFIEKSTKKSGKVASESYSV